MDVLQTIEPQPVMFRLLVRELIFFAKDPTIFTKITKETITSLIRSCEKPKAVYYLNKKEINIFITQIKNYNTSWVLSVLSFVRLKSYVHCWGEA